MHCDNEEIQRRAINFLRFPLAVGVVFIHCVGTPQIRLQQLRWDSFDGMVAFDLLRSIFSHILPSLAVPMFFFISGYLFFKTSCGSFGKNDYLLKLGKRAKTLLLPYVAWNVIFLLKRFFTQNSSKDFVAFLKSYDWTNFLWGSHSIGKDTVSWLGYSLGHLTSPIDVPLWFVRDLMVVVLISPLIYALINKLKVWAIAVVLIPYFLKLWPYCLGISSMSFVMFSVGAYFSINRLDVVAEARRIKGISYVAFGIATVLQIIFIGKLGWWMNVISPIYMFFGMAVLINISAYFSAKHKPSEILAKSSFFLYASHTLFLSEIDKFVRGWGWNATPLSFSVRYLTLPLLATICCFAACWLLEKAVPALHKILSGNR